MNLLTIQKDIDNEIIIEKSRFICALRKIEDEATASQIIKDFKKKYWDATHNCSAYIIGEDGQYQKSNDDGEPSGTAGIPMLEVLRKRGLHNVLAIVTRYFGGTKLGAGGLIRAYGKSVSEAIDAAGIAEKQMMEERFFLDSIEDSGKTLNILYNQTLFSIADVKYEEQAKIILRMKSEDVKEVEKLLEELLSRKTELALLKKEYVEVPFSKDI